MLISIPLCLLSLGMSSSSDRKALLESNELERQTVNNYGANRSKAFTWFHIVTINYDVIIPWRRYQSYQAERERRFNQEMISVGCFETIGITCSASWHLIRDRLRRKLERENEKKRMEETERATKRKEKFAAKRARKRENKISHAPISLEWQETVQYKQCPAGLFLAPKYVEHETKLEKEKPAEVILKHDKAATVNKSAEMEAKDEMAVEYANKRKFHQDQEAARDVKDLYEWDSRLDDFSASNTSFIDNALEYTAKEMERIKTDSIVQRNAVILKNILKDCGATSLQDIVAATQLLSRG